jgi:hypothetical protein
MTIYLTNTTRYWQYVVVRGCSIAIPPLQTIGVQL